MGESENPAFAIIGSGPSGCYTAQYLRKNFPDSKIAVFDRLAEPYGLLRFGVAPDHTGTRAIAQQFERLFDRDGVEFFGNFEVGKSRSLEDLRQEYDIVVIATGLGADNTLGIPGENLVGVCGSGQITRLINGHPQERLIEAPFGKTRVIVGHGNVAMDLVRLSLTAVKDLVDFGVSQNVANLIASRQLKQIHVVGRSEIGKSKFDVAMLNELSKLQDVGFTSDAIAESDPDPATQKRSDAMNSLVEGSDPNSNRIVSFHFGWQPESISGNQRVEKITFSSQSGRGNLEIESDVIFTAIGFKESNTATIRRSNLIEPDSDLERGYLSKGLYCVGWFRRGPNGTIPTNRVDAKVVSDKIIEDFSREINTRKVEG